MADTNKKRKKITDFFNTNTLIVFNKLIKNCVWGLFIFNLLLVFLYIMGNFNNFLDETQLLILNVLSISSILQVFLSLIKLLENLIYIFFTKSKVIRFFSILLTVLLLVIGVFFVIYATIIRELALGITLYE